MIRFSIFLLAFFTLITQVSARDEVFTGRQQMTDDLNLEFNYQVIKHALALTVPEYGEYSIQARGTGDIPKQRALEELQKEDGLFNVVLAVTQPDWEEQVIPIRIPVRMGLLSYRILAVHKDNLAQFSEIADEKALKKLTVGLRKSWATWEAMQAKEFGIVNAYSYEQLFSMLEKQRFDYIPRGIYEVFEEVEKQQAINKNIVVEPNLLLVLPAYYYMFVSPHAPRLVERMTLGLNRMVEQGMVEQLIKEHYGEFIERANVANRRVIYLGDTESSKTAPLDQPEYWWRFPELEQPLNDN